MNEYNLEVNRMADMINKITAILIQDETLLRLLYYPPKSAKYPDPLDPSLPDMKDREDVWEIIDDRILNVTKVSDLEDYDKCRVMVTAERRRPVFGNYLMANQGILISVVAHENYEKDGRIARISDRINDLLVHEYVGAIGKIDYVKGDPRVAPRLYYRYDHVYEYQTMKR